METVDHQLLPAGWEPIDSAEPRALGDEWLGRASSAVLRVPSAPIPRENNVLLNPGHRDFARVSVEESVAFSFDPRLL